MNKDYRPGSRHPVNSIPMCYPFNPLSLYRFSSFPSPVFRPINWIRPVKIPDVCTLPRRGQVTEQSRTDGLSLTK